MVKKSLKTKIVEETCVTTETHTTPEPKPNVSFFDRKVPKFGKYIQSEVIISTINWMAQARCDGCHSIVNEYLKIEFEDETEDGKKVMRKFPVVCLKCASKHKVAFISANDIQKESQHALNTIRPEKLSPLLTFEGVCTHCGLKDKMHIYWHEISGSYMKLFLCEDCLHLRKLPETPKIRVDIPSTICKVPIAPVECIKEAEDGEDDHEPVDYDESPEMLLLNLK